MGNNTQTLRKKRGRPPKSWLHETAAKYGCSVRAIQLDAERGEKISREVLDLIRRTKLDTGVYLDSIKNLSAAEQLDKVTGDLELSSGQPVKLSRLEAAWLKADEAERQRFLRWIEP